MVQILPSPTSLGSEVGNALGQGIQRGAQQGMQRGNIQQAIQGLSNLPQDATPFDLAKELISATAGIPGAERYVGQLFPLLLQQLRGKNTGLAPGGGPGEGVPGQTPGGVPQTNAQGGPQGAGVVGAGGQFERKGGYLTPPMNAEEMNAFAQRYSLGDPAKLAEGYQLAEIQNKAATDALTDIETRAEGLGVSKKEMPYFLQMAQQSGEKNPQKLLNSTMKNLEEIRALDNALVPGPVRGAIRKAGGLIPA